MTSMNKVYSKAAAGTFILNKGEPIHRWYSYLEGYSSCLVEDIVAELGVDKIHTIYDPFCGTGTTTLVASKYGIPSYYSETNPFMCSVIETKINCVKRLRDSLVGSSNLKKFLSKIESTVFQSDEGTITWDGFEKYFEPEVLTKILELQRLVDSIEDNDTQQVASIILASCLVRTSKMIRQGDLRFAKESEKSPVDRDVVQLFVQKLNDAISDIDNHDCPTLAETHCLSEDARNIEGNGFIDCVITSPPYLNGTNYVRNTKLELKYAGYVTTEADLPAYHSRGIIAGINNVSKRKDSFEAPACVQPYLDELGPVAYDKRIPLMVAGYFCDMESVIKKLAQVMTDNGVFIMDIGDSQFAGIHIPTHQILSTICCSHGFVKYGEEILRERRSKNGMILTQRLLKFRLKKSKDSFEESAARFVKNLPYRAEPFSGRNWGHAWHSLCSYHGKLKPAIAHFLVEQFTKRGEVILDPLCGVGTIPFEACLQGRIGIGNDLSELAYVVTKAKLEKPELEDCLAVIEDLKGYIENNMNGGNVTEDILRYEGFGFNGKVSSYFHPDTFKEILCARRYFASRIESISAAEAMVFSCLLHVLHGNRPYALSRNSHPLTPYAPKGEFVYKSVIDHTLEKLNLSYRKGIFDSFVRGKAIYGDYYLLTKSKLSIDAIICSPPFADSIRFYMQNWMRLWMCGWEAEDYKRAETIFLDQRQKKDFNVYIPFFEMCATVLKPKGKVVLHLGKTDKVDMAEELSKRATPYFTEVFRGYENVEMLEKHGIKDKGATVEHQFLFLQKA